MAERPMPFSELLAGYGTTTIGDDMRVESVFALLKLRGEDGSAAWSVRSGGARLSGEELLGVLEGLTASMRRKLTQAWKGESSTPATGQSVPVQFSELLAGIETVGVSDDHLIESVFAVIKARRPDGAAVWHVRSSEMKLSSEERLGALEGYAATIRQQLSEMWKW